MQIPVYVEPMSSGLFRAHTAPPFTATAEGTTSDEAVSKVCQQLHQEVAAGKRVVMVDVPAAAENPWLAMAGSLKDNPLFDEWQQAIRDYRKQRDFEDGIETYDRS